MPELNLLVQSVSFPLKSPQHPCEQNQKSLVQSENIHRQTRQALPQKNVGSSAESWYSWINKKAWPLSLIAPRAMTDTLLAEGFMPRPPLIIQTTSATTPFVLRAAPAHVDWWTHDPFSPSLFQFPLMSAWPISLHFQATFCILTQSLTFLRLLSVTAGMGSGVSTRQLFLLHREKKKRKKT